MAGNGYERQLEQLETTITGARRAPTPVNEVTDADVLAQIEATANLCIQAGNYARDHGGYLGQISSAFAAQLQSMAAEYVRNMVAAEERKTAELRRILGCFEK